ncbi:MAG: ADP-ribosylglycohydrolase family protein [Gammaproteobacteria bacterium]
MIGAIAGDVIGSVYEGDPLKTKDFPLFSRRSRFTDDTVLTVAVADTLLSGEDYVSAFKRYFRDYPDRGFGGLFVRWASSDQVTPYGSFGNGAAMRVSPTGWARDTLSEVLEEARCSARVTHDHPEGIRGAQATAAAVFMARAGESKHQIRRAIQDHFGYDLERALDDIRAEYRFDVSCQGSVPEAIISFLESADYEDAVRNAVSLGGDSDTMACIAGGIAEAFYGGVPQWIVDEVRPRLDPSLWEVIAEFRRQFSLP